MSLGSGIIFRWTTKKTSGEFSERDRLEFQETCRCGRTGARRHTGRYSPPKYSLAGNRRYGASSVHGIEVIALREVVGMEHGQFERALTEGAARHEHEIGDELRTFERGGDSAPPLSVPIGGTTPARA